MSAAKKLYKLLPESIRDTALLRFFGIFKVPLINWVSPKVVELSEKRTEVVIPLSRRTKNHLGSMYFGVLAVGADVAGGLMAMKLIIESGKNVSLAFKEFNAEYLKRPESATHFICEEGDKIKDFVDMVLQSDERHNLPVNIIATCPEKFGDEPVAKFVLTLSLRRK